MGLFLQLICLCMVTAFSYSSVIPQLPKYVVKDAGDPVGVTCPQNISNAWLDIVIAIDISTNMGPSQVRQITLNLASELSKYVISQGQVGDPNHYTRVAIITYGFNATVLYDLDKINSNQMFQSAITGIVGSTTDGVSNIGDALTQAYNLIYDQQPCDEPFGCQKVARPPVLVLFAASVDGDTNSIYQTAQQIQQLGTIIAVNYNPTNTMLTSVLNTIATPGMYFAKPWATKDMDWALMQSNCFCTWWAGLQLVVKEPSTQRYTRYAECFNVWELLSGSVNLNDTDVCGNSELGYPAAINAQETSDFIKTMLKEEIPNQFYIGLHRQGHSPTGKWMWYTFGGKDMPMGTFNDWASDADPNAPVTCAEEKRQPGSTHQNPIYKWEPVSCELWDTGATNVICSLKACTTDNFCLTAIPSLNSTKSRPRLPKNKQLGQLKIMKH